MFQGGIFQLPGKLGQPSVTPGKEGRREGTSGILYRLLEKGCSWGEGILSSTLRLGREDALEEGLATHSSILAWRTPWTEEPSRLTVHGVAKSRT